jgi:hypothetical protein
MKKIFISIIIIIFLLPISTSATLIEYEATPLSILEPASLFIITEVSFKHSTNDYVVFFYKSPLNKPTNLKGLYLTDDYSIKKIESDFYVASGQKVLLSLNSAEKDIAPYLYSPKKGLTGTTEQVILNDIDGSILDMVCWTSSSPTVSEIADMQKAYEKEGWHSPDINTCINSETVKKDESIKRNGLNDTNSALDWIPEEQNTTQPESTITNQEINYQNNADVEVELEEVQIIEITTKSTPTPNLIDIQTPQNTNITTNKTTKAPAKTDKSYKNGNLSSEIYISEIFANPDGTDTKKEWIELFNSGQVNVNLGNWIIDDIEGGSKPYTLPDSLNIAPQKAILIESSLSKISLGNREDSVRLFDFNNNIIDEIDYEDAPSGQSFSKISIENEEGEIEEEYIWTKEITPGQPNPSYFRFTATIMQEPVFDDIYFFQATDSQNTLKKIIFSEDVLAAPLAKATFTKGVSAEITVEKESGDVFILKKYKVIGNKEYNRENNGLLLPALLTLAALSAIGLYMAYKKIPWQNNSTPINDTAPTITVN